MWNIRMYLLISRLIADKTDGLDMISALYLRRTNNATTGGYLQLMFYGMYFPGALQNFPAETNL